MVTNSQLYNEYGLADIVRAKMRLLKFHIKNKAAFVMIANKLCITLLRFI